MLIHDVVNILVEGPDPEGMPKAQPIPASTVYGHDDDNNNDDGEGEEEEEDTDKRRDDETEKENEMRLEIEKLRRLLNAKDEMLKKLKETAAATTKGSPRSNDRVKDLENENKEKDEQVRQLQKQVAQHAQEMEKVKAKAEKDAEKFEKEKMNAEQDMNDLRSTIRRKDVPPDLSHRNETKLTSITIIEFPTR